MKSKDILSLKESIGIILESKRQLIFQICNLKKIVRGLISLMRKSLFIQLRTRRTRNRGKILTFQGILTRKTLKNRRRIWLRHWMKVCSLILRMEALHRGILVRKRHLMRKKVEILQITVTFILKWAKVATTKSRLWTTQWATRASWTRICWSKLSRTLMLKIRKKVRIRSQRYRFSCKIQILIQALIIWHSSSKWKTFFLNNNKWHPLTTFQKVAKTPLLKIIQPKSN